MAPSKRFSIEPNLYYKGMYSLYDKLKHEIVFVGNRFQVERLKEKKDAALERYYEERGWRYY